MKGIMKKATLPPVGTGVGLPECEHLGGSRGCAHSTWNPVRKSRQVQLSFANCTGWGGVGTRRDEEGDERQEGQRGKQGRRGEKGASWATGKGVFDRARALPEGEKEKEINMHRKTVLHQDFLRRSF